MSSDKKDTSGQDDTGISDIPDENVQSLSQGPLAQARNGLEIVVEKELKELLMDLRTTSLGANGLGYLIKSLVIILNPGRLRARYEQELSRISVDRETKGAWTDQYVARAAQYCQSVVVYQLDLFCLEQRSSSQRLCIPRTIALQMQERTTKGLGLFNDELMGPAFDMVDDIKEKELVRLVRNNERELLKFTEAKLEGGRADNIVILGQQGYDLLRCMWYLVEQVELYEKL